MAKQPKVTFAARVVLLKELRTRLVNDERDASIAFMHAMEDLKVALQQPGTPENWDALQRAVREPHAVGRYIKRLIEDVDGDIRLYS
jgi:hypothetical protein